MNREDVSNAFLVLREVIANLDTDEKEELFAEAAAVNPWYTVKNIDLALNGLVYMLREDNLKTWANRYPEVHQPLKVGIVMAGNIPLVGFHDLLAVLIAGHDAVIKLSSQDEVLPKFIIRELLEINPGFKAKIELVEKLTNIEAVIATGSDNSARYFRKYFKDYPHIIRKNRTSLAILEGNESASQLEALGDDIFSYFGMGCRNVAKLFLPKGYAMEDLIPSFEKQAAIANHPKYFNNYEYNKAIFLVNRIDHLDNGFALFTESSELVSPLSVVYFEYYSSLEEVKMKLGAIEEKLQCIVGELDISRELVPFGKAQVPELDDYADNVDTMKFLTEL